MVVGEVRNGEIFIPLTLKGPERSLTIEAIVDTGFTGHVVLPAELMNEFGHGFAERAESTLADGSVTTHVVMVVHLRLGDRIASVDAIEMGADPLVGMALLEGRRLTIDVIEGGRVTVVPLAPDSRK